MPAQKRALTKPIDVDDEDGDYEESLQHYYRKQFRVGREARGEDEEEDDEEEEEQEEVEGEEEEDEEDSYSSQYSSSSDEKPEFVPIGLGDVRKSVQCPICLGIIKKTRTVMECMHRFCRECIDKAMRLGNNECPACRTHCASRRSLRDDPRYDTLIAEIYEDITKYEEEELAFRDEDDSRNKEIQASIEIIIQRQEALVKRRAQAKDSAGASIVRSQRNFRNGHPKRRRKSKGQFQASDDSENENGNDGSKGSSSGGELCTEVKQRRYRRQGGIQSSQPSSSAVNLDGWKPEITSWGKGGARSQTRHGSVNGLNTKSSRRTHLSKLITHLHNLEENDDELDVHLVLISLDKQNAPSLPQPYLFCRSSLSVKHLCEYVADQEHLRAEEVEIVAVKEHCKTNGNQLTAPATSMDDPNPVPLTFDPCKHELQTLEGQETLGALKGDCTSSRNYLILAYRQKETNL